VAELDRRDDRESWLVWAIELGRRGLRPIGVITVHGPHGPEAPFMWGEANCLVDGQGDPELVEVEFRSGTVRSRGFWDVHSVRVWTRGSPEERWPIMPAGDFTARHRQWLAAARKERVRKSGRTA
jgi:hypothetical protein